MGTTAVLSPSVLTRLLRSWRVLAPVLCFGLVGAGWVLSTPSGAGVDESSHFVHLLGIAEGTLLGEDVPADLPQGDHLTARQTARTNEESGFFDVRAPLWIPNRCNEFDLAQPYDCAQGTPTTSTTQGLSIHAHTLPAAYMLPALASLAGSTTWRAMALARGAFLLQDLALMAVIAFALRRAVRAPTAAALSTLALCVTPLLAFQSGTLSPNGTETWAALAYVAALAAAAEVRSSQWWWTAVVCGAIACWSRDLGLVYVGGFGVAVAIARPALVPWLRSRRRSADAIGAIVLALAAIGATIWQAVLKASLGLDWGGPSQWWADLGSTFRLLWESIGLLGWVNLPIDPAINAVWAVAWIVGVAVLFVRADRRTRLAAAALGVLYVVATIGLLATMRPQGYGVQARHTMAIPMAAVVVLATGQPALRDTRRWPLVLACAVVAFGNLSGLLLSAQHNATGIGGGGMDFSGVAWAPPGGWPLSLALFGIATASVLALPVVTGRRRAREAVAA